jgi:HAD superfamily hydrolase (TIGR01549 family)
MDAIIFDLDWTILYLKVDWVRTRKRLSELFSKHKLKLGQKLGLTAAAFLAAKKIPENVRILNQKKVEKILCEEEMVGAKMATLRDGSNVILKKLKKRYFLGLVSNNGSKAINLALKKTGIPRNYFNAIISRDVAKELKPSPVPLVKAINSMPKATCYYYVGDEDSDMKAAKKTQRLLKKKIVKIGIVGWQGKSRLRKSGPDFLIENLHELEKILRPAKD